MSHQKHWLACATAGLLVSSACTQSSSDLPRSTAPDKTVRASLVRAESCDDLLKKLQDDAVAKLDMEIALFKTQEEHGYYGGDGVLQAPTARPAVAEETSADGAAAPSTNGGSEGAPGGEFDSAGPIGGSDTNTQVKDVDEADFVKMVEDRQRFYLLHGNRLLALRSWPPAETQLLNQAGLKIEGGPVEMFVHKGKAVVFSHVDPGALGLLGEEENERRWYQPLTKVTVVDLGEGGTMSVSRELYVEGHYTSSRRHDNLVRAVMQAQSPAPNRFYPDVNRYDPWGRPYSDEQLARELAAWRELTVEAIRDTELGDWLTRQYEGGADGLTEVAPDCGSHYTPVAGVTDYGLTRVLTLDTADTDAEVASLTVLGASSIVYANQGSLVLAHNDYRWSRQDFGLVDHQRTALHMFSLDGSETSYKASGWALGHLQNQFAIHAKDGFLYVSTTGFQRENPDASRDTPEFWNVQPVNQVIALAAENGELTQKSTTGPIGHEGETTRSTRFLGDRAYVVTFRQTDPLIVIKLVPDALQVLGELEIPGFSEYMHPLGDSHLLTIGRDADLEGRVQGLALQIFDISDDLEPTLAHKHTFDPGTSSSASYDHKAFTFYDEAGLLAFPMVDWSGSFSSTLQVFQVNAETGFDFLGAVDHTSLFTDCTTKDAEYEYYRCETPPDVRRGMFIEGEDGTHVYTISYGGVTAHAVTDLANAEATVRLPKPEFTHGGYFGGPVGVGGWVEGDVVLDEPPPPVADGGEGMTTPASSDADAAESTTQP